MKLILIHYFSILVLVITSSCNQNPGQLEAAHVAAIKAMSQSRADAFNEGDAVTIASYFTKDAILMAPNSPKKIGPEAVAAYYQDIFDNYYTSLESGYEQVTVDGDLAFGRGFAKVTLYSKSSGDTLYSTSKYLNILERQADGSWKTTHDIWNANE
jgi:uncharacterized protein (TIGR02246 family)